jgi:hypothetical protein
MTWPVLHWKCWPCVGSLDDFFVVPLLAPWFSACSIRLLEPTDEDHCGVVICMNHHFRTWRRGGVSIIHPAGSMFLCPRAPDPATFFHRYSTIPATRPCQAGWARWCIQKHAKTTEIHRFPKKMNCLTYLFYFPGGLFHIALSVYWRVTPNTMVVDRRWGKNPIAYVSVGSWWLHARWFEGNVGDNEHGGKNIKP